MSASGDHYRRLAELHELLADEYRALAIGKETPGPRRRPGLRTVKPRVEPTDLQRKKAEQILAAKGLV